MISISVQVHVHHVHVHRWCIVDKQPRQKIIWSRCIMLNLRSKTWQRATHSFTELREVYMQRLWHASKERLPHDTWFCPPPPFWDLYMLLMTFLVVSLHASSNNLSVTSTFTVWEKNATNVNLTNLKVIFFPIPLYLTVYSALFKLPLSTALVF